MKDKTHELSLFQSQIKSGTSKCPLYPGSDERPPLNRMLAKPYHLPVSSFYDRSCFEFMTTEDQAQAAPTRRSSHFASIKKATTPQIQSNKDCHFYESKSYILPSTSGAKFIQNHVPATHCSRPKTSTQLKEKTPRIFLNRKSRTSSRRGPPSLPSSQSLLCISYHNNLVEI
jgi:hypothetical protein